MQIQIVVNVHQDGATAGWEGWQAHRECFQCIIDHTSERGTAQLQKQKMAAAHEVEVLRCR